MPNPNETNGRPNLLLALEAGLSLPVAVEACLRELIGGKRLSHWAYDRKLHQSTVSAVVRGKRGDQTIRGVIAGELGIPLRDLIALYNTYNAARAGS